MQQAALEAERGKSSNLGTEVKVMTTKLGALERQLNSLNEEVTEWRKK
jgi:hypothetical protein